MSPEDMLKSTAVELRESLQPDHVIGKPVDLGDKLVIPVTRFGFGFGAGGSGGGEGVPLHGEREKIAMGLLLARKPWACSLRISILTLTRSYDCNRSW